MELIIFFSLILIWFASVLFSLYVWLFEAKLEFGFWPLVLSFLPVVNTIFLIVITAKFTNKGFFGLKGFINEFKKGKDGQGY